LSAARITSWPTKFAAVRAKEYASSAQRKDDWLAALTTVICGLVRASAGQVADENTVGDNLIESLNAIHLDRLENADWGDVGGLIINLLKKATRPDTALKVDLDTILQTAKVPPGLDQIRPGNLYQAQPALKSKCPVTRLSIGLKEVFEACAPDFKANVEYKRIKREGKHESDAAPEMVAVRESMVNQCRVGLIEVSPICDFAQGKRPVCRFVAALIVPDLLVSIFPKSGQHPYLFHLGGIRLPNQDGTFHLLVNARFVLGIKGADKLIRASPLLRLRSAVLTSLQSWLSAHAARPGYLAMQ
jgi:hypothetical protein